MGKKNNKESSRQCNYEKYDIELVHRESLKNAPYKPMTISDTARRALKKNLSKIGLLAPIVWNRRTGNIVSGHQRIRQLDALEKTSDYTLRVAVVDLDEKQEKEQNIFMNNNQVMGDFDLPALETLMKDQSLDVESMGFDLSDTYKLFGTDALSDNQLVDVGNRLKEMRDCFESIKSKNTNRDSPDFYLIVIFKDYPDRLEFTNLLGLEDNKYVDGRILLSKIMPDHEEKADQD